MGVVTDIIINRVTKDNKNFMGLIVGNTGSGKSYACLNLGEDIDKEFNIDRIVFDVPSLIEIIKHKKKYNIRSGSVVVLEEVGVSADARSFYSQLNKSLTYILETFRTDNIILLMNVPAQGFTDKKVRMLCHMLIQMVNIDKRYKRSYGKPRWIQNNAITGKTYYKATRTFKKINGRLKPVSIDKMKFKLPSKKLRIQYEKKRSEFLEKVKDDAANYFHVEKQTKEEKQRRKMSPRDLVESVKKEYGYTITDLIENCKGPKGKMTKQAIKGFFSCADNKAIVIRTYLESLA